MLGASFLNHGDYDGEVGEDEEDQGFPPVAKRQIDDAAANQQSEHRFAQNLKDNLERRAAIRTRKFVVPFSFQPCLSFGFAETFPVRRCREIRHSQARALDTTSASLSQSRRSVSAANARVVCRTTQKEDATAKAAAAPSLIQACPSLSFCRPRDPSCPCRGA